MRHISRDDRGRYTAWKVRVTRNGILIQRNFSDANYGGKAGALAAARDYLQRVINKPEIRYNTRSRVS